MKSASKMTKTWDIKKQKQKSYISKILHMMIIWNKNFLKE